MATTSPEIGDEQEFDVPKMASQRLSEQVAGYIRERIFTGKLLPGDFLRTEQIAASIGVSNTPVREGLLLLNSEGYLELMHRRGFRVASFTRDDIRDLFWVQADLGGELAARATRHISDDDLAALAALVAEHEDAVKNGASRERIIKLGHQFHRSINIAAGSRRMTLMLGGIVRQMPNRFYNEIDGHLDETVRDHPAILDAMQRRRPGVANALMRDHLLSGADPLIERLEDMGVWSKRSETG